MANTITSAGSVTVTTDTLTLRISTGLDYTMTGSNLLYEVKDLASGSWQPLVTSSLTNLRLAVFTNRLDYTTIAVAKDSAGSNVLLSLEAGDSAILPFSSSISTATLYARSYVSSSLLTSSLDYLLVEF